MGGVVDREKLVRLSSLGRPLAREASVSHSVEVPAAGNALQLVLASGLERDPRSGDEILHGLRDEDLGRSCKGSHSCADVDRDPLDFTAGNVDLSRVQTGPDLKAKGLYGFGDRQRASDTSSGSVERGQEPVSRGVDLVASVAPRSSLGRPRDDA